MRATAITTGRVAAAVMLVCYVAVIALILLNADPSFATDVIARTERALADGGAPAWVTWGDRVQMILNALMFAPITFLASLAAPRHPWGNWVAYSFAGSGPVEVVQAFVLEPRAAQYVGVVANTLGGLMGALLAVPLAALMRRVSDR